jgi:RNA polymerase-binding transcription factor DksA
LNLDEIEAELAGVDAALARLDEGTYWTDEVTGEPLNATLLETHPTARRNQA